MSGNTVDVARVSEATHRDASGREDAHDLHSELNALRVTKETLVKKGLDNNTRIAKINEEIRSRAVTGKHERARIVEHNQHVSEEIRQVNLRLKPLQADLFTKENGTVAMAVAELRREVFGLRGQIRELVALVKHLAR